MNKSLRVVQNINILKQRKLLMKKSIMAVLLAGLVSLCFFSCNRKAVDPICGAECFISAPGGLRFGNVGIGKYRDRQFSIENVGESGRLIGTVSLVGTDARDFKIIGVTNFDLGPGEGQTFTLRFEPLSPGLKSVRLETGNKLCFIFPPIAGRSGLVKERI